MKRNILLALVAALTISMVAAGLAFAQGNGPGGRGAGTGIQVNLEVTLSDYMPTAMADVLGLDVDDVNARLASGETLQTIALSLGYTADQLTELMASIRTKAIGLAIADGVVIADQSAFLQAYPFGGNVLGKGTGATNTYNYMHSYNTGDGTGICDGSCIPQNNSDLSVGTGIMRRGGAHR